jgi:hypothetical protein
MNVVLIETSGNQAFIFATNKLRENVGASELIVQVGTRFVLDAVQAAGGQVPENPRNPTTYPAINDTNPVEIILAVSGKALLLVRDKSIGQLIVRHVTLRALQEAPGLEVRGVVSQDFDFAKDALHPLIGEVHRQFEVVRSRFPGPMARFQRPPIVAECTSSGLPAATYDTNAPEPAPRSTVTIAKRNAAQDGLDRIRRLVGEQVRLPPTTKDIEDLGCDWLAIVHADGNGLGQVFLNFDKVANTANNRNYIDKLRRFSLALDECTEKAFCQALAVFHPRYDFIPIVPLVLGGDDLTVVCDGRQALQFTKKFIDGFEAETCQHPAIHSILPKGVTSCAGVAIIKPHFPFFSGYQLAEQLLASAKTLAKRDPSKPLSALDYHILYDASGPDLERIRRELTVDDGQTLLVGRPYVVTADSGPVHRRWSDLECRIAAVRARDEDNRRLLPNSMLHELRQGLFLGRAAADAQLHLVRERYRQNGLDRLLGETSGSGSLFWQDTDGHRTALLDAIDTAEFWEAQS